MGVKRTTMATVLAAVLVGIPAVAIADDKVALGVVVGDPTGADVKLQLSSTLALEGVVGLGLLSGAHLTGYVSFLWQRPIRDYERAAMDWYLGVGPQIALYSTNEGLLLGPRGAVGLDWTFFELPLDVFVEAAAGVWLLAGTEADVNVVAGARYHF